MLTSDQVAEMIHPGLDEHLHGGGQSGRLRRAERSDPTPLQRQFIADLAGLPEVLSERPHRHPGANLPAAARKYVGGQIGDHAAPGVPHLTIDDVAWLQALPSHPASVSYADARRLLALQKTFHRGGVDPADRATVDAVAQPVADHHDRLAALVDVHNAQGRPYVPIPASAVSAMADAIASEVPALLPHEAIGRAGDRINALLQDRFDAQEARLAAAHAALDAIDARIKARKGQS